jgi:hypothetical protein
MGRNSFVCGLSATFAVTAVCAAVCALLAPVAQTFFAFRARLFRPTPQVTASPAAPYSRHEHGQWLLLSQLRRRRARQKGHAHPGREYSGGEVYIPPSADASKPLGINHPEKSGPLGTRLNLHA